MSKTDILTGRNLSKSYGTLEVIKNVSIIVKKGEFVALAGKSGSGKTTLLSLLSGLEHATSGEVILADKDITRAAEDELALFRREKVGFVFQNFNLIPTLTAWENVALPLFPVKMQGDERYRRAAELLDMMEMGHRLEHLPHGLSGGEKQRVAIARALVNNPTIVFADEPTGNLDSATGESIMKVLGRLHKQQGMTMLMVTHDSGVARNADRVIKMKDGGVLK
jgi:ABC-type lipoprotein export system ATPase subunit